MKKKRNHMQTPHVVPAHAAELAAAAIVAFAAGLSVDAIACRRRLLRALDDDDPRGADAA